MSNGATAIAADRQVGLPQRRSSGFTSILIFLSFDRESRLDVAKLPGIGNMIVDCWPPDRREQATGGAGQNGLE